MTHPIRWCALPYSLNEHAVAESIVGRRARARAVKAVIGYDAVNVTKIKADIEKNHADGVDSVLWLSPNNVDLDAGKIDVPGLATHPSVAAVAEVMAGFDFSIPVRILYECANVRAQGGVVLKGPDGKLLYRYVSPSVFRETFDGIARVLHAAAPLTLAVWSYGPNGWPFDPAIWEPMEAEVGDCSLWGYNHLNPLDKAGINANAFADHVADAGLPLIVGESGSQTKDAPLGWTDEALRDYMKAHVAWCVDHEVLLLCGPGVSSSYGMTDWTTYPLTAKWLTKALTSSAFVTLPL